MDEKEIDAFYRFVILTVENITSVNVGNALKIRSYLKIKDTDKGYDLQMFFKAFVKECSMRAYHSLDLPVSKMYSKMTCVTLQAVRRLNTAGVSKGIVFDMWLFDVREALNV